MSRSEGIKHAPSLMIFEAQTEVVCNGERMDSEYLSRTRTAACNLQEVWMDMKLDIGGDVPVMSDLDGCTWERVGQRRRRRRRRNWL